MKEYSFSIEKLDGTHITTTHVKAKSYQEAYELVAKEYRGGYVIS